MKRAPRSDIVDISDHIGIETSRLYNGFQEVLGTDRATTPMTYLDNTELLTRTEFNERIDRLEGKIDTGLAVVNQRMDGVLLAVVAGLFLLLAAIIAL